MPRFNGVTSISSSMLMHCQNIYTHYAVTSKVQFHKSITHEIFTQCWQQHIFISITVQKSLPKKWSPHLHQRFTARQKDGRYCSKFNKHRWNTLYIVCWLLPITHKYQQHKRVRCSIPSESAGVIATVHIYQVTLRSSPISKGMCVNGQFTPAIPPWKDAANIGKSWAPHRRSTNEHMSN